MHADDWRHAGTELMSAATDPLRRAHPEVRIDVRVVHADPATAVLEVPGASLVLVERAHGASWLPGSLGRTARHLLTRSPVPVEVEPVTARSDDDDPALELAGTLRR